jgi:transposase-like protein
MFIYAKVFFNLSTSGYPAYPILQSRAGKDILIACTDNLTGFADAIKSIFPDSTVQTCIVHQICNSIKYVAGRNQKEFMRDLKLVYRAVSKEQAEVAPDNLELKWGEGYPIIIKSWRNNWDRLSAYFQYRDGIRPATGYYISRQI